MEDTGKMNFTQKEMFVGGIEAISKGLLAILVWLAVGILNDMEDVKNSNADMLNRIIEINVKMDNNKTRIDDLENDMKEMERVVYRLNKDSEI